MFTWGTISELLSGRGASKTDNDKKSLIDTKLVVDRVDLLISANVKTDYVSFSRGWEIIGRSPIGGFQLLSPGSLCVWRSTISRKKWQAQDKSQLSGLESASERRLSSHSVNCCALWGYWSLSGGVVFDVAQRVSSLLVGITKRRWKEVPRRGSGAFVISVAYLSSKTDRFFFGQKRKFFENKV